MYLRREYLWWNSFSVSSIRPSVSIILLNESIIMLITHQSLRHKNKIIINRPAPVFYTNGSTCLHISMCILTTWLSYPEWKYKTEYREQLLVHFILINMIIISRNLVDESIFSILRGSGFRYFITMWTSRYINKDIV